MTPDEYAAALRRDARDVAAREIEARRHKRRQEAVSPRPELYSSAADHAGRAGMVTVWDADGRYLGCLGVDARERLLGPSFLSGRLTSRWTQACWWLSKKLNRSVFGKREFTVEQWAALTPEEQAKW